MKRILLSSLFFFSLGLANAQQSDTVSLGSGISKQVHYSLLNGVVKTEDNNDWDIAFQTASQFSASILINPASGTELYMYPGDTTDWATLDTTGMSTWTQMHNSDTSWDYGAFSPPSTFPDYGWGKYNSVTHHVVGHKLFVIKLGNGAYQKIWIKSLINGTYTFRHATLNNSMDMVHTLKTSDFSGKNFGYFSLQSHTSRDKDPLSTDWDLYFGKYTAFVPTAYAVVGALQNANTEAVKAFPVNDPSTYMDWGAHSLSSQINQVGYDWKSFNMSTFQYEIADSTVYFVRTQNADVFKLVFTYYGGSANGKIAFDKTQVHFSGFTESPSLEIFDLYPNPANDRINLTYNSSEAAIYEIYNVNGVRLVEGKLNANSLMQSIDVSMLSSGMHIISISSNQSRVNKTFIIN